MDERLISVSEVRLAIAKAKSGKAAGPSGVAADMLKAAGRGEGDRYLQCSSEGRCSTGRLKKKLDGKCV